MPVVRQFIQDASFVLGLLMLALMTGYFFSYAVVIIPALETIPPESAIRAMDGVSHVIRRPLFAIIFFGAFLFPIAAGLLSAQKQRVAECALAAALIYGFGVIAVTFGALLPLNTALATAHAAGQPAAEVWRHYSGPWQMWNLIRLASGLAAFIIAMAGFALRHRSRLPVSAKMTER
ncbi:putative membrane protein [Rhodoligotrophos appendicifer]|uniref:anthrone oxygenase family protein n=1 Tax=Rhodoligotrophos appendicifer TaxID=987056 RepID=UPI001185472D|nr:anthrone oxygenase family protein [Rhodoligotrophos appendicifer]